MSIELLSRAELTVLLNTNELERSVVHALQCCENNLQAFVLRHVVVGARVVQRNQYAFKYD
eukprot:scaffold3598_cov148-Skeletonema_dohrnii-CCMP3373.AAC.1